MFIYAEFDRYNLSVSDNSAIKVIVTLLYSPSFKSFTKSIVLKVYSVFQGVKSTIL